MHALLHFFLTVILQVPQSFLHGNIFESWRPIGRLHFIVDYKLNTFLLYHGRFLGTLKVSDLVFSCFTLWRRQRFTGRRILSIKFECSSTNKWVVVVLLLFNTFPICLKSHFIIWYRFQVFIGSCPFKERWVHELRRLNDVILLLTFFYLGHY